MQNGVGVGRVFCNESHASKHKSQIPRPPMPPFLLYLPTDRNQSSCAEFTPYTSQDTDNL